MITFASGRERNHSRLRHSSRNLPLKLSVTPFCQGFPGSINAVPMPCAMIQDSSALDTNSGPLSLRRQFLHPLHHGRVLRGLATLVAQRRSRHFKQRAGPPRRETTLPAIRHLPPTSQHAYQFFAATFFTSISRSRSRTSFFSRVFSVSSCFRR